jgi:uncharacterized membrane protein
MPLVVIPAVAATWSVDPGRTFILQLAFLVLALADPLASWIGETYGRQDWIAGATVHGSAVFFGITLVIIGTGLFGGGGWSIERSVAAALSAAVVTTASEAVSRRGWDNVFVVLSVILVLVPLHKVPGTAGQIGFALAVGIAFGAATYATRTLTAAGAVGGGLFAASLVGLGGWAWAVPGFVFFVGSSSLSIFKAKKTGTESSNSRGFAHGTAQEDGRTLPQVLANGGVAWLLLGGYVLLPPSAAHLQTGCYVGFLGALAAAAADTWATEIGERSSSRSWSLRTGARVEAGLSGAVSGAGTLGALLGAATVGGAAVLGGGAVGSFEWRTVPNVVAAGSIGMVVDSLAGAFLQARYRKLASGRPIEEPDGDEVVLVQGWKRIDNEAVNWICTTAGAVAAVLFC